MVAVKFNPYLILFVAASLSPYYAIAICFWPDGSVIANQPYVSCNSNNEGACCDGGDICTAEGYCLGTAGFAYRGGCTSSDWQLPECARRCIDGSTHP